jgi:hypothetical protein
MRIALLLPVALVLACTPKDEPPGDTMADTSPPEDTAPPFDTGLYDQLNGSEPAELLAAIEFEATSHSGELRGLDHLLGHPTVLWFYPLASTAG